MDVEPEAANGDNAAIQNLENHVQASSAADTVAVAASASLDSESANIPLQFPGPVGVTPQDDAPVFVSVPSRLEEHVCVVVAAFVADSASSDVADLAGRMKEIWSKPLEGTQAVKLLKAIGLWSLTKLKSLRSVSKKASYTPSVWVMTNPRETPKLSKSFGSSLPLLIQHSCQVLRALLSESCHVVTAPGLPLLAKTMQRCVRVIAADYSQATKEDMLRRIDLADSRLDSTNCKATITKPVPTNQPETEVDATFSLLELLSESAKPHVATIVPIVLTSDNIEGQRIFIGDMSLSPIQVSCATTLLRGLVADLSRTSFEDFKAQFNSILCEFDSQPACVAWKAKDPISLCVAFGAPCNKRGRQRGVWAKSSLQDKRVEMKAAVYLLQIVLERICLERGGPFVALLQSCTETIDKRISYGTASASDFNLKFLIDPATAVSETLAARHIVSICSSCIIDDMHPIARDLRSALLSSTSGKNIDDVLRLCVQACTTGLTNLVAELVLLTAVMKPARREFLVDILRRVPSLGSCKLGTSSIQSPCGMRLGKPEFLPRSGVDNYILLADAVSSPTGGTTSYWMCESAISATRFVCQDPRLRAHIAVPLLRANDSYADSSTLCRSLCAESERLMRVNAMLMRNTAVDPQHHTELVNHMLNNLAGLDRAELVGLYALKSTEATEAKLALESANEEISSLKERLKELQLQVNPPKQTTPASNNNKIKNETENAPNANSVVDSVVSTQSTSSCSGRDLVERIRRERGLHYEAGSAEREVVDRLLRTVQPAIQILSTDIYKTAFRCFFELLQNADDCHFAPTTIPSIEFVVNGIGMIVSNNELHGFTEKDVLSICDIGKSTKLNNAAHESTGRKGIGFKSVFALSDTPVVWSGNYQLCFNTKELGGAIIPQWIDSLPNDIKLPTDFTTHIYLPTIEPIDGTQLLQQITGDALLFLRRIRQVRVNVDGVTRVLTVERNGGVATLKECNEAGVVVRSRKFFLVTDANSSVRVAIPDPSWFELVDESDRSFPFSTFLPVADVGLPFVVQGDFNVTANREDIHETDTHNVELRSRIAPTLYRGLMGNNETRDKLALFLPESTTVSSHWWRHVVIELRDLIREGGTVECYDGQRRLVSQVIVVSDDVLECFSSKDIHNVTGLAPVAQKAREVAVDLYGCERISAEHVVSCIASDATTIPRTPSWYSALYVTLSVFESNRSIVPALLQLHIFCDTAGEAFSYSQCQPILGDIDIDVVFGSSIPLLHPLSFANARARLYVIQTLGITVATLSDICSAIQHYHMYILPNCVGEDNLERNASWVDGHITWLLRHLHNQVEEHRNWILLPSKSHGAPTSAISYLPAAAIYLEPLENCYAAQLQLKGVSYPVLYLQSAQKQKELRTYLIELGINSIPRLVKFKDTLVRSVELEALWSVMSSVELCDLLFAHWPYYRKSGEVIAYVRQMRVPVLPNELGEEEASWFMVFEKDVVPSELTSFVPTMARQLGTHRDLICADLGIKKNGFDESAARCIHDWLMSHVGSTNLSVWTSFYRLKHKSNMACGLDVYVSPDVIKKCQGFKCDGALVPITACVWLGVEEVSRWSSTKPIVLNSIYPEELKEFFCATSAVQAFHAASDVVSALRKAWIVDEEKIEFRDITKAIQSDVAKLYTVLSEYDPVMFTPQLQRRAPVLNGKLRFYSLQKAQRSLVYCDDQALKKVLRIDEFHSVHSCIPASLAESMNLRFLSQAVKSSPVNRSALQLSETQTIRFRAALVMIDVLTFSSTETEPSGRLAEQRPLQHYSQQLKVYVAQNTVSTIMCEISIECATADQNRVYKQKHEFPFLYSRDTKSLVIPATTVDFVACCRAICANIGKVEKYNLQHIISAGFFESTLQFYVDRLALTRPTFVYNVNDDFPIIGEEDRSKLMLPKANNENVLLGGGGMGAIPRVGSAAIDDSGVLGRENASMSTNRDANSNNDSDNHYDDQEMDVRHFIDDGRNRHSAISDQDRSVTILRNVLERVRNGEHFSTLLPSLAGLGEFKSDSSTRFTGRNVDRLSTTHAPIGALQQLETEFADEIGRNGERCVFDALSLQRDLSVHWLSRFAVECGATKSNDCTDGCGYDLKASPISKKSLDWSAILSQKFVGASVVGSAPQSCNELLIEVKTHLYDRESFLVSSNEFEVMCAPNTCTQYVVVVVALLPRPTIRRVLFQPFELMQKSVIHYAPQNYLFTLGGNNNKNNDNNNNNSNSNSNSAGGSKIGFKISTNKNNSNNTNTNTNIIKDSKPIATPAKDPKPGSSKSKSKPKPVTTPAKNPSTKPNHPPSSKPPPSSVKPKKVAMKTTPKQKNAKDQ